AAKGRQAMQITEIRVHLREDDKLKAFVTVTFDNCFVVRNMKLVEGSKGLILCMPSRKLPNGTYKDIAHPISMEFRKFLEEKIMAAYQEELKKPSPKTSRTEE
ncbi:MAG: SpoVG family protein, partial [Elusimicrobiota bacterium]